MSSSGLYVYCLVRSSAALDLGAIGLEHEGAPGRVATITVGPIAAVVSPHARRPVLPLRRNLAPHHQVLREAMAITTVVPMNFGHVARSERELVRVLQPNKELVAQELDRLDGKVEMGLKVRWDVPNVFGYIADGDPALARLRDALYKPGVRAAHADKMELGRLFEERRRLERLRLTEQVLSDLEPFVIDAKANAPHGEDAIADLAFLIERGELSMFEDHVRRLAAAWPSEYVFQPSGPWAPFNFVELELAAPNGRAGAMSWGS